MVDIKETKRYGCMHRQTDNVKTVYPPQTKFGGGGGGGGGYNKSLTILLGSQFDCWGEVPTSMKMQANISIIIHSLLHVMKLKT